MKTLLNRRVARMLHACAHQIHALLPTGALEVAKIAEQEEQAGLRLLAESLEI
ncbi:hypothetical protein [Thiomonas sp.]|jgi:hypothetical protein|uniref:hypothetical protein n=1 Tax=Thiomonas sp. TaxID=2047785 RepID=UPI00258B167C|nr:hypothetical protein [Thiomonas sp.]